MMYGWDILVRARYEEMLREAEHQRAVRRLAKATPRSRHATER